MFGLGLPELIVIFVIALLVFGPKKLPDLGKSIGRAMAEFKKASDDFQESVRTEMKEVEKSTGVDEIKKLGSIDVSASMKEVEKVAGVDEIKKLGSIDVSASMKEVEKVAGVDEIKKLDSIDISASEQMSPVKSPTEQGTVEKPEKKKTREAKRNV
jgi:sec-independent protein translocase protein TatA